MNFLFFLALAVFILVPNDCLNQIRRIQIINQHNSIRGKIYSSDMQYIIWSWRLERLAQDWVDKCVYEYGWDLNKDKTEFEHIGQLIWAGKVHNFDIDKVIDGWNKCDDLKDQDRCPSRRQLLHSDTEWIGCAYTFCPNLVNYDRNSFFMTCFYSERDFAHMYMYTTGEPCSSCSDRFTQCRQNMCLKPDYRISRDLK